MSGNKAIIEDKQTWTPRSRFVAHALFCPVDRPPHIETHGFWPQTVNRWHDEGLPMHVRHMRDRADFQPGEITIEEYFQQEVYTWPPFIGSATQTPFWPAFEREVLEESEEYVIFRDTSGIVRRDIKQGRSLSQFLRFPVETRKDWDSLKDRLDPTTSERYAAAEKASVEGFNQRNELIPFVVCGAYGFPRNLFGEERLALMYYDDPELLKDVAEYWLRFYVENIRRYANIVDFDFVYFWEDMAYKNGPFISPKLAHTFIMPYYRELIQEMRQLGLKVFCLDSDGNVQVLLEDFIAAGINNFLPCEIAAGMEPQWIRERFGRQCSIQGGIDKRMLMRGKNEIHEEVMRKVPQLLQGGGYVPGVDHAVPNDVSFKNFCYFVELLRKLTHDIQPKLK